MSECRGCGKPILWLYVPGRPKPIPVDPMAAVYVIDAESVKLDGNGRVDRSQPLRGERVTMHPGTKLQTAVVTHFATCPNAAEFSGRNKPAAAPGRPSSSSSPG